jgi:TetR/AcrR family transcriptional repressor of nem operon
MHERIVQAASAAFRAHGVGGVGVGEIMASVGLTHGGFYAHFSSKEELLREALKYANSQETDRLATALESIPVEQRFHAAIDVYLSPEHAAHPEHGCPMAALGPELARAGEERKREMARGVRRRLDWLRGLIPKRQRGEVREEQLVGVLACMVGGLILARVVGGKDSAALLRACREFLHRSLGEVSSAAAAPRAAPPRKRRKSPRRSASQAP